MKCNMFKTENFSSYTPVERHTCKSYFSNEHKKCSKHYDNVIKSSSPIFKCPYGYTTIKDGTTILTSLITENSDTNKIVRRANYVKVVDDYDRVTEKNVLHQLKKLNLIDELTQRVKPLIHDTGNAINYLLTIKDHVDDSFPYKAQLTDYYHRLSKDISNLREYSNNTRKFDLMKDYEIIYQRYSDDYKSFCSSANDYYENAEKFKDSNPDLLVQDDPNKSYFEGLSLIKTLVEYNEKLHNLGSITSFSVLLKPHKMMKKLSRLLAYRGKVDNIRITFNCSNDVEVSNSPDLFIALFTLLDNAIKYSLPNASINISISSCNKVNTITITNQYDGNFTTEDISRLGEKGFKGNSKKAGSGLGLFLVGNIVSRTNCSVEYFPHNNLWTSTIVIPDYT